MRPGSTAEPATLAADVDEERAGADVPAAAPTRSTSSSPTPSAAEDPEPGRSMLTFGGAPPADGEAMHDVESASTPVDDAETDDTDLGEATPLSEESGSE